MTAKMPAGYGQAPRATMTAKQLSDWIERHKFKKVQAALILGLSLGGLNKKLDGSRNVDPQTQMLCEFIDQHGLLPEQQERLAA